MSVHLKTPAETERRTIIGLPTRLALIGVALAAVAGTFAYFSRWFSPEAPTLAQGIDRPTPAQLIDRFVKLDRVHSGFRRQHAKGLGVSGLFKINGNGVRLCKA